MKTKYVIPALLLAIALAGKTQAQTDNKQQIAVPLSEPGKPCKVKVGALSGSIKVVGYEGKEVVVEVEAEKKEEPVSSGGMRRIGGGGAEVTAQEDNNTVTINAGLSHIISIYVKVPANASEVQASTVNDGNIVVDNISGQIEINNVNGWIRCENVSGSVVANTVNGDVVVGFKSVNPQAAMAFSTLNGKIDVTFPADLKAKVKLKAERGDVFSDFDVAIDKGQTNAEKPREDHMYKITIDDWVYGTINGGGPEVMMKTTNGDVYVRKSK
jgi:Putative adhesin